MTCSQAQPTACLCLHPAVRAVGNARRKMRLGSIILFVALCSFTAYYIYEPIPEEIDERWKLMLTNSFFRSLSHLVRENTAFSPTLPSFAVLGLLIITLEINSHGAGYVALFLMTV